MTYPIFSDPSEADSPHSIPRSKSVSQQPMYPPALTTPPMSPSEATNTPYAYSAASIGAIRDRSLSHTPLPKEKPQKEKAKDKVKAQKSDTQLQRRRLVGIFRKFIKFRGILLILAQV